MRLRQEHGLYIIDPDRRKTHAKWTIAGESRTRLENMLALSKNIEPISDAGDEWDADPWLLGVSNGVVDLRTGALRDGVPADRITMSTRANYDPTALCPEWDEMIARVFSKDAELILYVQCALGYSITGVTREQCFFLNTGGGSNGKGTTLNIVAYVMGDYADDLPFSAFEMQQHAGIPNDIAKIVGKRFITASETKEGARLNEARVKSLTGCDPMTARFLHREFFTFQPVAKFWLSCNTKPIVTDISYGFWRRVRVVPWLQQFMGGSDDKELKDRLKGEADGILAWLVRGCVDGWQAHGLITPDAIEAANSEYETESDTLAPFLDQRCTIGAKSRVGATQLYREYLDWAADADSRPLSQKAFAQWVRKQFKAEENHNLVTYIGLSVRPA
jgi:putative DNA primase/helicase